MKDLFIPLKKYHFERFAKGTKKHELRPYGLRWNEKTCVVGRGVTLSCGYGKHRRLYGTVSDFSTCLPSQLPAELKIAWDAIYGGKFTNVALISIKLDTPQDARA